MTGESPPPERGAFDPPKSSFTGPIADFLAQQILAPPSRPGLLAHLGRFEILHVLGAGGMGVVVLARDPNGGALVAVKLVRPELLGDAQIRQRFLKEAGHMQRLKHRGIVAVLEIADGPTGPFFVMPYLERGNLAGRLRTDAPLGPTAILDLVQPVAEGLGHAHRRGIIHRDLKPGNILLAADGSACLADFGLARTLYNDALIDAASGQWEGTAPYMSPAVAAGHAEDTRCDIYALGALMYEMMTGQPPYEGASAPEIRRQIIAGPPKPIRALNPKADERLAAVAEGAMARELRDRYADMDDVSADLARIRDGKSPRGPHGRVRERWQRRLRQPRTGGWVLAAACALVLSAWWLGPRLRRAERAPSLAVAPAPVPAPSVPFHFGAPVALAIGPHGDVYIADRERAVVYQMTDTGRIQVVAGRPGAVGGLDGMKDAARFSIVRGLTFDPTGFIFYLSDGFRIRMLSFHGPVWTLAGSFRAPGPSDGPVRLARFKVPAGVAIDRAGTVYVADLYVIRKITAAGVVSTLAGADGHAGRADGVGAAARFSDQEKSLAVGPDGAVYVGDGLNHRVRKITPAGAVTTLPGYFGRPAGVAVDAAGNVVVADAINQVICQITPQGMTTALAGAVGQPGRADGTGAAARFNGPRALAIDAAGTVWIADAGNQTLRKLTPAGVVTTPRLFTQD